MPVVEYDSIINIHTLSWFFPDIDLIFDRANHIDCDVHISLLFDVEDEKPDQFTGVRVGFPANREDRLGYLTPPASPRKYREETLSGIEYLDSRQYIGNISSSPSGSNIGVKQTLKLSNPTSISEVSIIDSPISDGESNIFDATTFSEYVKPFKTTVDNTKADSNKVLFDKFDKFDYITDITDDLIFNFSSGGIEGNIYIHYDTERIHISKSDIQFLHGLDPFYKISGIGSLSGARSPLKVYLRQDTTRRELFFIKNKAGLRIYLLINDKNSSLNLTDYRWISIDYAFNDYNWKNDNLGNISNIKPNITSSSPGIPKFEPASSIKIKNIPTSETVTSFLSNWISSSSQSKILQYSFGNVLSFGAYDNISFIYFQWVTSSVCNVNIDSMIDPRDVRGYFETEYVKNINLMNISSTVPAVAIVKSW